VTGNVFGYNVQYDGSCFDQSALCSQIGNATPTGHAISVLHDNFQLWIGDNWGATWGNILNFPAMLPAFGLTQAAFMGEYYVPLLNLRH